MSRHTRSTVPQCPKNLQPRVIPVKTIQQRDETRKLKQKEYYDKRHGTKTLEILQPGDLVWIKDKACKGQVIRHAAAPRSYVIQGKYGPLRRNRIHLQRLPRDIESMEMDWDLPDIHVPYTQVPANLVDPDIQDQPPQVAIQAVDNPPPELPVPPYPQARETPRKSTRKGRVIRKPARFND